MHRPSFQLAYRSVLLFVLTVPLAAQTAQVTGKVVDSTGAVAVGAEIRIRNTATGTERKTTTNDLGLYSLPLLSPGDYLSSVEFHSDFGDWTLCRCQIHEASHRGFCHGFGSFAQ